MEDTNIRTAMEAEKDFVKSLVASGMSVEEIASRLNKDITEIRKLLN